MALLGIDLGGTKLAMATFTEEGRIIDRQVIPLDNRKGKEVGLLITDNITLILNSSERKGNAIFSIGISVPGISHIETGTVWAPNIPGWSDYPLLHEVTTVCGKIPIVIDSDRACYISGEFWKGNAQGCNNAIFLAVGTGIGAGIMINGEILRGGHDIAGAIGWMALNRPFDDQYSSCGCFEYYSSGEGIAKQVMAIMKKRKTYAGELVNKQNGKISSQDVFAAYKNGDPLAAEVIQQCIEFWGMAVANLISLFNPGKIIFGGGVFGPAIPLIPEIIKEARKWAQPVSINQVSIEASAMGGDAGVYGAGFLALKNLLLINSLK